MKKYYIMTQKNANDYGKIIGDFSNYKDAIKRFNKFKKINKYKYYTIELWRYNNSITDDELLKQFYNKGRE